MKYANANEAYAGATAVPSCETAVQAAISRIDEITRMADLANDRLEASLDRLLGAVSEGPCEPTGGGGIGSGQVGVLEVALNGARGRMERLSRLVDRVEHL